MDTLYPTRSRNFPCVAWYCCRESKSQRIVGHTPDAQRLPLHLSTQELNPLIRLLMLFLISASCLAADLPPLKATKLFTQDAKNCVEVDLKTWTHPVLRVFAKKRITLERLQLCNDKKYPIFYVHLPYDPQGQTQSYFGPLYAEMQKANSGWPYAFVSTNDNTVISVSYPKKGIPELDMEMYAP